MKKRTAIRGHALQYEGRAVVWDDEFPGYLRLLYASQGSAACECGTHSPVLPTTAARQRWHAVHKDEVRPASDTGLLWCPACGKQGLERTGCRECGASADDIARLEPGPWNDWGH